MKFIVIDTETASLKGGVCDLAFAQIDENFNVVNSAESLIDPEVPISPGASGIHHITNEMVYASPTLAEFMAIHDHPFSDEGLVIAAHNAQFDIRMVGAHLPRDYRKVCTLKLSRNAWPDIENHKLQTLRYTFNLGTSGTAHRAMADVLTCISLLELLADHHKTDLAGLVMLCKASLSLDTKMPFGKHKDEKLKNLPLSYVRWLVEKADMTDPDLREALALRLQ